VTTAPQDPRKYEKWVSGITGAGIAVLALEASYEHSEKIIHHKDPKKEITRRPKMLKSSTGVPISIF
jgi:hypothetical protein